MKILSSIIASIIICSGCTTGKILPDSQSLADPDFRKTRAAPVIALQPQPNMNQDVTAKPVTFRARHNAAYVPATRLSEQAPVNTPLSQQIRLSPGDKISVMVPEGTEFSGIFTINLDGTLNLPYIKPIVASGKSTQELAATLRKILILQGLFKADFVQVDVSPVQWAATNIVVSGAVYNPGNIMINQRSHTEDYNPVDSLTGDFAYKRLLSSALKAAGGVRPDADLRNITLIRNNRSYSIDLSGVTTGKPITNPALTNNDQIIIPSVGYLQTELMRPTVITPPGFRIYLSNLTIPADSNNKASNNKFASSVPPGSRLLKGAMTANCVGGTASVNANRHVILAGIDPLTNTTHTLQRSLKELLTEPNNDSINPYLMPEDSIACYDSGMTNARDIARSIGDFLRPFAIMSGAAL